MQRGERFAGTSVLTRCLRVICRDEEDGAFIDLLCECRGDLASIHAECADRWFRKKSARHAPQHGGIVRPKPHMQLVCGKTDDHAPQFPGTGVCELCRETAYIIPVRLFSVRADSLRERV